MLKIIGIAIAFFLLLALLLLIWAAYSSHQQVPRLGYAPHQSADQPLQLKECPASPNCVATQTRQADKQRPALVFSGSVEQARIQLKTLIGSLPRTHLVSEEPAYLHYTFTTRPLPFLDDVEFLFDAANGLIHYRSASRIGYTDLGVNSRRMQKIATLWEGR